MKNKKIYSILFGLASFALLGNIIYRLVIGLDIGFFEVIFTSMLIIIFLFTLTWGSREKKDGILPTEELGEKIESKSNGLSYHILVFLLLLGLIIDRIITGSPNMTLIIILAISLILPAILAYVIAQTYQITPNVIGKTADRIIEYTSNMSMKKKNRLHITAGLLTYFFILGPLFNESRSYYDFLVYLFGEPAETGFNPFPIVFTVVLLFLVLYTFAQIENAYRDKNNN